jgi:P27 family predicted phage terminase small subunit
MTAPKAPKSLSTSGRRLWRSVVETWHLDRRQLEVLRSACEASDRAEQARVQLDSEGLTVSDRYGQIKPHPAASIETSNRSLVARLLRELQLEPAGDDSRPVRLY